MVQAVALEIVAEMALKAIQLNPQVQPVNGADSHGIIRFGLQRDGQYQASAVRWSEIACSNSLCATASFVS
jgi:hypothetical protein